MKNSTKNWLIITAVIVVIFGLFSLSKISDPGSLASLQTTDAPWDPEIAHLGDRLKAIGLPKLQSEGTALHIHQHLDIFIDGKQINVPEEIGIDNNAGFISDIHTHDTTGIIHVESPTIQTFTLGQFFDIWGVYLAKDAIGSYKNQGDKSLKVFVNGKLYTGDPQQLSLAPHEEIVITYGTPEELPKQIPSLYKFPAGY